MSSRGVMFRVIHSSFGRFVSDFHNQRLSPTSHSKRIKLASTSRFNAQRRAPAAHTLAAAAAAAATGCFVSIIARRAFSLPFAPTFAVAFA
mmetsp:Transcript_26522/g.37761  ORF Transcript_26522/g.37761 Transcript_26522/m.37761 type:complete len:91 (-) Transcript_26522:150-422(-)